MRGGSVCPRPWRRLWVIGPVFLVMAACTSTTTPTTTATAPVPIDTPAASTTTPASTQPEVTAPVDICPRGLVWEPGTTYIADCFVVSVAFEPTEHGWRSVAVGAEWIEGTWIDPDTSTPALQYVLLAYEPSESPGDVIESIVNREGVDAISAVRHESIAGHTSLRIDVTTKPEAPMSSPVGRGGCTTTLTHSLNLFGGERPGYVLMDRLNMGGSRSVYGLGACLAFRIWAIDVDGATMTLIAASVDTDRLPDVGALVESLFASVVFGRG